MKLSEICVRRPVFAVMLISFIVTLGIFSFRDLGVDLFPRADIPMASVSVRLPGATPEEVNSQVVLPLEEAISTVSGIDELRVWASEGSARIMVQFVLDRDINTAVNDVREKVAGAVRSLPPNILPPVIQKADPDSSPVITFLVSGDRSVRELTELADRQIRRALETVDEVGGVSMNGGRRRQIRVFVDGDKLTAYGMTAQDVQRALQRENIEAPGGRMVRGLSEFGVRTLGRVEAAAEFNDVIVANVKGAPIRIRDVGRVEDTTEEPRSYAALQRAGDAEGHEVVILEVRRQIGSNTVKVVDAVKAKMAQVQRSLPAGVRVTTLRDDSLFIKASVAALEEHLLLGSLLASLVVLLFIRNIRTVIIASLAIPTSIVATFTLMRYMDFTLNNMTLLALTLAVGIVIDDAIIVLENIFRWIEEKDVPPKQAAVEATREIGLAVLATTISLVIIFVPIAFMTGFAKRFVNQFGWTMAMAIMVSMLVSFTLTPMMSSLMLKKSNGNNRKEHHGSRDSGFFHWQDLLYGKALNWSLDHRAVILLICVGVFASTFLIAPRVGRDWIPSDDMSEFQVIVDLPEGASLEGTVGPIKAITQKLRALPGVEFVYPYTHGSMGHGHVMVRLVPPEKRKEDSQTVAEQARQLMAGFPNVRARIAMASLMQQGGGGEGNLPIRLNITGPDLITLAELAKKTAREMKKSPDLADVDVGLNLASPEVQVRIDRARASELGVRVADVASTVRLMMSGEDQVSVYKEGAEQYDVSLQLLPEQRNDPNMLSRLIVPSTKLGQVRLDSIASLERGAGPTRIERLNRQYSTSVTAAPTGGAALDSAARATLASVARVGFPPGYSTRFSGQVKIMDETGKNLIMALLLASIFMYMVLAAQFESLLHPFIIMLTLPLSLPFALFSLWITGNTLNLWSALGVLLLLGIVKKNGILQIDYTNRLREQGVALREAIVEANHVRLRPIMMTTCAIVAGLIPTALGIGAGSKQRAAIAITIIGGQTLCLLLTLLLVPVAYSLMEEARAWLANRAHAGRPKEARA